MSAPRKRSARARRAPFTLADQRIAAGRRGQLELPIARLMSGTPVALPVLVLHGRHDGPMVWLSAAVHGDEICGVEIIRRVMSRLDPRQLRGTVITVPIVNVHGFNTGDRYLPDRRDLNRSFPGSARGSLAARIAHLMMTEIIARCSVGIDLHTGSDHRINLPQVRADLDDPATLELARAFGAALALHSRTRDGSLRQAATEAGSTVLLFEGGEADRFDSRAIRDGTAGALRVLAALDMIDEAPPASAPTRLSRRSTWVRASSSGILHFDAALGEEIEAGGRLATIYDAFGKRRSTIRAKIGGMIAGHTQRPLVNRGDAIAHIAEIEAPDAV
jgi:predicted deacylase